MVKVHKESTYHVMMHCFMLSDYKYLLLGSYLLCVGIYFDKMHFTYSRSKMCLEYHEVC